MTGLRGLMMALVCLAATRAGGEEGRPDSVVILDAGIYENRIEGRVPADRTATGNLLMVSGDRLVTATDTICARLGMTFGFEYRIVGLPLGAPATLDYVTRFPAPGVVNSGGQRFEKNEFTQSVYIGLSSVRSYTFEEPWEMVPGIWVFEFHHQGRKLGEKSFTVLAPCPLT